MLKYLNNIITNRPNIFEFHIINLLCGLFLVSLFPFFWGDFEIFWITYPYRIISLLFAFYIIFTYKKMYFDKMLYLVLIFFLLYLLRMTYDIFFLKINYQRGYMYFATYIGTCIIPFWSLFFIDKKKVDFNKIMKWIYVLMFFFCFVNLLFNDYSQQVERSTGVTQLWFIIFGQSGVTLSFLSIFIFDQFKNKYNKILSVIGFFLGLVIIFISASKGPLLTVIMLTVLSGIINKKIPNIFKNWSFLILCTISFFVLINTDVISLFNRLKDSLLIKDESTNQRIEILSTTFNFIKENFFLGKSFLIQTKTLDSFYPHNLFLEAFMVTGFFGGILFLWINIKVIKEIIPLFRNKLNHWILFLFLQYFIQGFFSASLYSSSFYWILLGVVMLIRNKK